MVPIQVDQSQAEWDEIERRIAELSTDGPALPPDFCRADIYSDHD